jgi:type IV pilus assembly protein PilA
MLSFTIDRLNERRRVSAEVGEDAGFTLIELMVVLLILAILLAIAIPTFLGVTGGANDRAAQSNLNTALTNAKAAAEQNNQSYSGLTSVTLKADEPSLQWTTGTLTAPTGVNQVSVYPDTSGNGIILASLSKTGTCWFAVDNIAAVTGAAANGAYQTSASAGSTTSAPTNQGTFFGKQTSGTCTPAAAPTATTWSSVSFSALG